MPCERYSFSLRSRRVGVLLVGEGVVLVVVVFFVGCFFFVLNIEEMKLVFCFGEEFLASFGNVGGKGIEKKNSHWIIST